MKNNLITKLLKLNILSITLLIIIYINQPINFNFISHAQTLPNTQQRTTANTDDIDEIVVVGTDGYIHVYNYEGDEVYTSDEGGWFLVTTGDLNEDGDYEIIAVNDNNIKVYDPQIVNNTPFEFEATYSGSGDSFTRVAIGDFFSDDTQPEIALLRSLDDTTRLIIYDLENHLNPEINNSFLTGWDDFAIGDYDADGDDDFALIYWNASYPSGSRSWFELRRGSNPADKLRDSNDAGVYDNNRWYDVVSGNFVNEGDNRIEWVATQNGGKYTVVQKWDDSNKEIDDVWKVNERFDFLAVADYRNDGKDQIAMLKNISSGAVLKFAGQSSSNPSSGTIWGTTNLTEGWLNIAAGNLDVETNNTSYKEAVIIKSSLIRIYLISHKGDAFLDCIPHNDNGNFLDECVDISGSFTGEISVADLGVNMNANKPEPADYEVLPSYIQRTVVQSQTIASDKFYVYGDIASERPINWEAIVLPDFSSQQLKKAIDADPTLKISITSQGVNEKRLNYKSSGGSGELPVVPWITLSAYSGTTPSTITTVFSNTMINSPLHPKGAYKATIFIWRTDTRVDRFRYVDVTILNPATRNYIPIVLKENN